MNCLVCKKQDGADAPGVCPACLADAKLGRLVRSMKPWDRLGRDPDHGGWHWRVWSAFTRATTRAGRTPEEALEKAMGEGK